MPEFENEATRKIKEKFALPDFEAPEQDPHDVGPLESKELTEELLKEYHSVNAKLKSMEEIREMLRNNILKVMGREESAVRGKMAVWIRSEVRKGNVDYKRLLQDKEITEQIVSAYRKPDTNYQKLEVKEIP